MTLKPDTDAADAGPETMSADQPLLQAPRRGLPAPRIVRGALAALLLVAVIAAAAGALGGGSARTATSGAGQHAGADAATPKTDAMAPLPTARPKLVQPVAGQSSESAADSLPADAGTAASDDTSTPKVTGPATISPRGKVGAAGASNLSAGKATALENGVALPPLEAPEAVLNVIRAGNIIARTPYKWGGGHGRFQDNGYDCSGSVTYALYYAGLIDGPHTSGDLMAYGKPGPGKWITIYANGGHVYMTVAGIRFDTSAASSTNHFSRWQNALRTNGGFEVRHPPGL